MGVSRLVQLVLHWSFGSSPEVGTPLALGSLPTADQNVLVLLIASRACASTSGIIVPIRTSSSAVKNQVRNHGRKIVHLAEFGLILTIHDV
jgi:hypothetical protein